MVQTILFIVAAIGAHVVPTVFPSFEDIKSVGNFAPIGEAEKKQLLGRGLNSGADRLSTPAR